MEWDKFKPPFTNLSPAVKGNWVGRRTMSIYDSSGKRVATCIGFPAQETEQAVKAASELAKMLNLILMKCVVTVLLFASVVTEARAETVDRVALLDAIAMVESDRGATSRNIYQIRRIYWADVNRRMGWNWHASSYRDMVYFKAVAEDYINAFWDYYGKEYTRTTGKPVTAEVLARIHNGGPQGWRKKATAGYWRRVKKHYLKNLKTKTH